VGRQGAGWKRPNRRVLEYSESDSEDDSIDGRSPRAGQRSSSRARRAARIPTRAAGAAMGPMGMDKEDTVSERICVMNKFTNGDKGLKCNKYHFPMACWEFLAASVDRRIKTAQENNLCLKCLNHYICGGGLHFSGSVRL